MDFGLNWKEKVEFVFITTYLSLIFDIKSSLAAEFQ